MTAKINRRKFLTTTGAAMSALPLLAAPGVFGANDRVNVALIGCGGRGRYVARGLVEQGANLGHICDVNEEKMDGLVQFVSDVQQQAPTRSSDLRRVLDDKAVDAVAIATPDHWHALATVWACQAGKDVYVEKPHANTIMESRAMVQAAEKYGRIVQVGVQNRSAAYVQKAKEYVASGKLGKIGLVHVYNLKPGGPFSLGDPAAPPENLNWDMWLGPAPERPFYPSLIKHGWLHFWDYCNGDLADDGIHQFDLALMVLGDPRPPAGVSSTGGRLVYKDDSETPDVQTAQFSYDDFVLTFEMTNYPRYMQKTTATIRRNDLFPYWTQNATRVEIYGSELTMTIGRHGGGWQVMTSGGKVVDQMYGRVPDDPHYRNFLDCIKSRQRPTADIRVVHQSLSTLMLAIVAHRAGNRSVLFNWEREQFVNDAVADAFLHPKGRGPYQIPKDI